MYSDAARTRRGLVVPLVLLLIFTLFGGLATYTTPTLFVLPTVYAAWIPDASARSSTSEA